MSDEQYKKYLRMKDNGVEGLKALMETLKKHLELIDSRSFAIVRGVIPFNGQILTDGYPYTQFCEDDNSYYLFDKNNEISVLSKEDHILINGSSGHIEKFEGEYDFLSNFYYANVEWEGILYPTTEHAFQAAKSLDRDERLRIASLDTPGMAKREGRKLQLREDWDKVKVGIMYEIVKQKFETHSELKNRLLETKHSILIEGNYWKDNFWGCCPADNPQGKNKLGFILMKIREELKENNIDTDW